MSPFVKYALSLLLGVGLGTLGTAVILNKRIAQENATIEDLKQEASKRFAVTGNSMVTGQNWEHAQKAIRLQRETIERLTAQLKGKTNFVTCGDDATPESEKPYTVLFDRPISDPDLRKSQWMIKGRVIPYLVKAPREAVYYFIDGHHGWEGPITPDVAQPRKQ